MNHLSRQSVSRYIAIQLHKGENKTELMEKVAAYLIETKQTRFQTLVIKDIYKHLETLGQGSAVVSSAHELSTANKERLQKYVKSKSESPDVSIEYVINDDLIGGFKIEMPALTIDESVKSKLEVLRSSTR